MWVYTPVFVCIDRWYTWPEQVGFWPEYTYTVTLVHARGACVHDFFQTSKSVCVSVCVCVCLGGGGGGRGGGGGEGENGKY